MSLPPSVYQNLSTCHDLHIKNAIVDLPITMIWNSKCTSGDLLSLLGAQNKDNSSVYFADITNQGQITLIHDKG